MVLSREEKRLLDSKFKKGQFRGTINPASVGKVLIQKDRPSFNPQRFPVRQMQQEITKEQMILQQILGGGERTWGTGQNLPKVENILNKGGGIIKNGDYNRETGRCFGL